jgi:hypothetical protein
MSQAKLKTAYVLSAIIAILMIMQSMGGLFLHGLYRNNLFVQSSWYGNDLVTLVITAPLLMIGALLFSRHGSPQAQLLWLGMLDYTLYNCAFYLFGAAFNSFFLIYSVLFTLAIYALIFTLMHVDVVAISQQFQARTLSNGLAGMERRMVSPGHRADYNMGLSHYLLGNMKPTEEARGTELHQSSSEQQV